MTSTVKRDLDNVRVTRRTKYLGQRLFHSKAKCLQAHTHTHTHTADWLLYLDH